MAVLIGDVVVGAGCYVGAGAVLRGDIGAVSVGDGSNVQENCVLHMLPGERVLLHSNTHIGHGCTLHGCEIQSNVQVGMGSTVGDGARIGANCLIGAHSFVRFGQEIPEGSVAVGNPARVIKEISEEKLGRIRWSREIYQGLARRYLAGFSEIVPSSP
jgi:phenylacetic acid degradation protein